MTTLIKDLIDIPERVQRGDFVLRLAEGVTRAEETLREYVVTPELRECFDNALAFIRSALQSVAGTQRATLLRPHRLQHLSQQLCILLILRRADEEVCPSVWIHFGCGKGPQ